MFDLGCERRIAISSASGRLCVLEQPRKAGEDFHLAHALGKSGEAQRSGEA